jgi:hypothetical protein
MDHVTDARLRWLESSIDLVRAAFSNDATHEQCRQAATILRAAAALLDGGDGGDHAAPSAAAAAATPPPTADRADALEGLLAALLERLTENDGSPQQTRNGSGSAAPLPVYPYYGAPWWPWPPQG